MSLREEISDWVYSCFMDGGEIGCSIDEMIEGIYPIIEKRIDERIERYHNKDTMYPSIMQRIGGMEEIKEMLR